MARRSSRWRFVAASASAHLLLAPLIVLSLSPPPPSSLKAPRAKAELIEIALAPFASHVAPRTSQGPQATSPRLQTQVLPHSATQRRRHPARQVAPTKSKAKAKSRARAQSKARLRAKAPAPRALPLTMRLAMRSRRRPLDLKVDPASILRPGRSHPASPSPVPPKTDTRAQAQGLKARLDASLARERARRNVPVGRVPPLLYDIERDAQKMFRPTWSLSENDASKVGTMGDTTKRLLRALGRSYLKALHKYATGQPDGDREKRKRTKMLDSYAAVMRVTTKSATAFSCDVCADIEGTIRAARKISLHLKRSSKRPRFDRLALSALDKALRIRTGIARPEAAKGRPTRRKAIAAASRPTRGQRLHACYRFIAKYYRVPPIPMVGCQFDEAKLTLHCYYPGKKILKADVALLSVDKRSDPS